jgi:hypothetical protein
MACLYSLQRLRSKVLFKGAYLWFLYRSKRFMVPAPSNGNCGIFALEVFEEYFRGTPLPSRSREAVVHGGRTKLAQALRQYRVVLCNMYGYSCRKKVSKVIWKRVAMHQKVKFNADWCHSCARVKAPLDLHAWSMALNRNVCVVIHGAGDVITFAKDATLRIVNLSAFQPDDEDIVLLLNDNHFDSLVLKSGAKKVTRDPNTVFSLPAIMGSQIHDKDGDEEPIAIQFLSDQDGNALWETVRNA